MNLDSSIKKTFLIILVNIILLITILSGCTSTYDFPENPAVDLSVMLDFEYDSKTFQITLQNHSDKNFSFWADSINNIPFYIHIVHNSEPIVISSELIANRVNIKANEICNWQVPWQYENISPDDCQAYASMNIYDIENGTKGIVYTIKSNVINFS